MSKTSVDSFYSHPVYAYVSLCVLNNYSIHKKTPGFDFDLVASLHNMTQPENQLLRFTLTYTVIA